jgi:hypothetical protein
MDLHRFDIFFSETDQTIFSDGRSSESSKDGGHSSQSIEIGQGQFQKLSFFQKQGM